MGAKQPDLRGSLNSYFQLGLGLAGLKATSSALVEARSNNDGGQASLQALNYRIGGSATIDFSSPSIRARNAANNAFVDFQAKNVIGETIDSIGLLALPLGVVEGFTLSRNAANPTTQIDISAGRAGVVTSVGRYVAATTTTITKRLDQAWVFGPGNGGNILTGSTADPNMTYHVAVLFNRTTLEVDFIFTGSPITVPNASWVGRLIGAVMTDANGHIRAFTQVGDRFYWNSPTVDLSTNALSTSAANLQTLTVPTGLRVLPFGHFETSTAATASILFGTPGTNPVNITPVTSNYLRQSYPAIATNTSGQILVSANAASANCSLVTHGFEHPRGAW